MERVLIQPVGAINEKIEGFFDVCRARRALPRPCHRDGRRGARALSGRAAGARGADGRYPDGSFNEAVERALARNVDRLRELRSDGVRPGAVAASAAPPIPRR
jgi:hypothetical protein